MPHRFAKILALIAAVQMLGGHWMALQSVAWVGMVIDYSQKVPLRVAIEKTFDGAHPCDLCQTVSKGRSEEKKDTSLKLLVKFEAVLLPQVIALAPSGLPWIYPRLFQAPLARSFPPPTPPPLV